MKKKLVKTDPPDLEPSWRAESDANILHQARQIKTDPDRHIAAREHVKRLSQAVGRPVYKKTRAK
jgi:hypothetical protein